MFFHPGQSDWVMNSEKPAIALCIAKELFPERQLDFATDLQLALNAEGRDLDDDEAYRHLLEKYSIDPDSFYLKLKSGEYRDQTYEFSLCRQLQVTGFPSVFIKQPISGLLWLPAAIPITKPSSCESKTYY